MNKEFEKIIEKLEEELKLADREKERCARENPMQFDSAKGYTNGVANAIESVKQEAEQFGRDTNVGSNGWIPVSERLPEEHKMYDITFKNSAGIHSDSAIYNPYLKIWLWDADETELVESEILAWAEKREPYQPKGE